MQRFPKVIGRNVCWPWFVEIPKVRFLGFCFVEQISRRNVGVCPYKIDKDSISWPSDSRAGSFAMLAVNSEATSP